MSVAPGSYDHNVEVGDVRDVFRAEGEQPPEDTSDGDAKISDAIDKAVNFAGPRIYDRVTSYTFDTAVAFLAADYLYSYSGGGKKKKVKTGPEAITYFEGDDTGKFAELAARWDTSDRLFQKTVGGFVI